MASHKRIQQGSDLALEMICLCINALVLGVGIMGWSLDQSSGLPNWVLAGAHASGALLALWAVVDMLSDRWPRREKKITAMVRARADEPFEIHETVRGEASEVADLLAFFKYGVEAGSFSRRTFLPENAPHFALPSGGGFGRKVYLTFIAKLQAKGILDDKCQLALDLSNAIRALGGQARGQVGGWADGHSENISSKSNTSPVRSNDSGIGEGGAVFTKEPFFRPSPDE